MGDDCKAVHLARFGRSVSGFDPADAAVDPAQQRVKVLGLTLATSAVRDGTGILFAIDIETGKMLQWRINQADSEILWADDSAFYYRRTNELLRVDIVKGPNGPAIGSPLSILKADILLDVHAAFRSK